jgi:hypothetical protein
VDLVENTSDTEKKTFKTRKAIKTNMLYIKQVPIPKSIQIRGTVSAMST